MFLDISPLHNYKDFRLLYIGQFFSIFGNMISYVAVPYQVYQLTQNNFIVGLLGAVQLVPMLFFSLLGGTYADRVDRKKMMIICEVGMLLTMVGLMINAALPTPSVVMIFIWVALLQALSGFHRPAMEAISQILVQRKDFTAMSALSSLRRSAAAIVGPSLGGFLIAGVGIEYVYFIDALTFLVALYCLAKMSLLPIPGKPKQSSWKDMQVGLCFALSKPQLMGTYLVDIIAMLFAFPIALYPAMSEYWQGATTAGYLFSAIPAGALLATIFSGWAGSIRYKGKMVVCAAMFWGIAIAAAGIFIRPEDASLQNLCLLLLCIALAGGADMISGIFRGVIWNESIPNRIRGRLSGIEMISYMSGPLLGNLRAGMMAEHFSVQISVGYGGVACVVAVAITAMLLPKFWQYRSSQASSLL